MTALGFYEKVVVLTNDRFPELTGRTGYVLGISEENGTVYGYTVSLLDDVECYSLAPEHLKGSGEFADRSLFYEDDALSRVRVRVVDGRGKLAE